MSKRVICLVGTLIVLAAAAAAVSSVAAVGGPKEASGEPLSQCNNGQPPGFSLESTIAFSSTRDNPTFGADAAEIYLINPDGTNPRRLTDNQSGDGFASLSPDGKKIVFDSDRVSGQVNVSDLFLMNADGSEQTFLTRGSSATWSPDCKDIAFHASASGSGTPLRPGPGSATSDSDIFVANVDDLLEGVDTATNITGSWTVRVNDDGTRTRLKIADDPDWSPDGEHIAFTAHDVGDEGPNWPLPPFRSKTAEIFVIAADGSGTPQQLTHNLEEERGPVWSPDGNRIAFACRAGTRMSEICVMNADGSNVQQLTSNTVPDLTPTFSPDGQQIVFHRDVPGQGDQLWLMNADGTPLPDGELEEELTSPPGINLLAHWGELRIRN